MPGGNGAAALHELSKTLPKVSVLVLTMYEECERCVVQSAVQRYNGAEIARQSSIGTKTVKAYKRRIQEKISLAHRTDYVRFAIEGGILGM